MDILYVEEKRGTRTSPWFRARRWMTRCWRWLWLPATEMRRTRRLILSTFQGCKFSTETSVFFSSLPFSPSDSAPVHPLSLCSPTTRARSFFARLQIFRLSRVHRLPMTPLRICRQGRQRFGVKKRLWSWPWYLIKAGRMGGQGGWSMIG